MLDSLKNICKKLGVNYTMPNGLDDCEKSKYLVEKISNFIGG